MELALLVVVVMTCMVAAVVPTPSMAPEMKAADSWRKVGMVRMAMTKTLTNLTDQHTNMGTLLCCLPTRAAAMTTMTIRTSLHTLWRITITIQTIPSTTLTVTRDDSPQGRHHKEQMIARTQELLHLHRGGAYLLCSFSSRLFRMSWVEPIHQNIYVIKMYKKNTFSLYRLCISIICILALCIYKSGRKKIHANNKKNFSKRFFFSVY